MKKKSVYGICGMCTVRCPMMAEVVDGKVEFIQGNPHAPGVGDSLCARGAAGLALTEDSERPQYPMIRDGARGEGKWRKASWDEALDYVVEKLNKVRKDHGDRAVMFSDRGGPFRDHYRAFLRGIGTPNYINHDVSCARNVQHSAMSVIGYGRKGVVYDLKNAKHVVLQTRNIFEAINVKEVNDLLDAKEKGCKITVIDIRANVTAGKADNFFLIRPGTDYAFNLAVINVLITKNLYDKEYVAAYMKDFDALAKFIAPYTPKWAEEETGVAADRIVAFAKELAKAAPSVIWHGGWMTARYSDSFYVSRAAYLINGLLGSYGAKGGMPFAAGPGDAGAKGLKSFMDLYPKPTEKRVDGVGWEKGRTHQDAGPGLLNHAFEAIATGKPYPVKAYICHRHDPLMSLPDTADVRSYWENLDLLVAVTFTWSDSAWHADVVLPMSPYLERESIIATKKGLKPHFFVRRKCMEPIYDTKSEWEIYRMLAEKMGLKELAELKTIEDVWNFQLEGTGHTIQDFDATGFINHTGKPIYKDVKDVKFNTPSGKIEVVNEPLEKSGFPSLKPNESPERPPEGKYRITFGRCGVHTQGHTVNNPLLFEQMPENVLWINTAEAAKLGVATGDLVTVGANGHSGQIRVFATDHIHPECVFMVHGFGHTLPVESRAIGKGVADNELMPKGLMKTDKAGGAVAMQEFFINVAKA